MDLQEQELLTEYHHKKPVYEKLAKEAYNQILKMIDENNFFVMDVQYRLKDSISLKDKLERKEGKYTSLQSVTDLCGLRIVCYFVDTVDEISRALKKHFVLDEANSMDTRERMVATQFGYMSLHRICSFPAGEGMDPEIVGIPFEIQIRTVLQHAWAEIEHDLGYKSDFDIPRAIRRNFSRVAGLLEIADIQFTKMREDSEKYNRDTHERIRLNDCDDVLLDNISLRAFVNDNAVFRDMVDRIAKDVHIDIEYTDPHSCIKQLEWFGFETLGDVKQLISNNLEFAINQIKKMIADFDVDIMTTSSLFRFLCEGELIRSNEPDVRIYNFLQLSLKEDDRIEKQLERIRNAATSLS